MSRLDTQRSERQSQRWRLRLAGATSARAGASVNLHQIGFMLLENLEPLDGGGGLELGEDPRSVTIILWPSEQRPHKVSNIARGQLLRRGAGEAPNRGPRARQPIVARGAPCHDRLSQK